MTEIAGPEDMEYLRRFHNPFADLCDLVNDDMAEHTISERGQTSLVASGYEWTCLCGALNTIIGYTEFVTCGDGTGYGDPHPWRPTHEPCGLTFEVDTFNINDAIG